MKFLIKIATAVLILGATVSPALADGFYGAFDFGQSELKDACIDPIPGMQGCEDTATVYRIAGGYQITPMWGVEVSYGDYGKANVWAVVGASGNWRVSGLQVSGTGTFPLGAGFDLIGKVGIARTKFEVSGVSGPSSVSKSATSTKAAFGIGAQYNVSQRVAIRAQYEDLGKVGDDATTGAGKVTLLTAGVVFKF